MPLISAERLAKIRERWILAPLETADMWAHIDALTLENQNLRAAMAQYKQDGELSAEDILAMPRAEVQKRLQKENL